jgi:CRISPR system Cascade subunit CasE
VYLSRIRLDTKLRKTMLALASPQVLHSAIESSFSRKTDEKQKRILWRIDNLKGICYLLVLSAEQPDFSHIVQQFGYQCNEWQWETKNYNILLDRLRTGQVWQFRLRANPVHSSFTEKDKSSGRGKVFAHVTHQQQKQWLLTRAQANGFSLTEDAFDVIHTEWKKFRKSYENNHEITLRIADFEGLLTISDVECFKKSLLSGIGRAKAYGCGLLTIAHCRGEHDE